MGLDQGRDENPRVAQTKLVAQIEFTEWTPDGHLRHSKFVGLREGKKAGKLCGKVDNCGGFKGHV